MSSERPSKSRAKAAEAGPDPVDAEVLPETATQAEIDAQAKIDADAEVEARAELAAQAAPDDDAETAAKKAARRAELAAARQAKLEHRSAKERAQIARAAERAKRAVEREERDKANADTREKRARKLAQIEKEKAERKARAEQFAATVAAREAAIERARKRRSLSPEEQAEAAAYAESDPPPRPSVWKFQIQIIKALMLRDLGARFGGRSRLGYIWALLNPILLMCGMILVFSFRGRLAPPNLPLLVFTMTGYPLWFGFYGMWGTISKSGNDESTLMFPQITIFDLIVADFLLEAATSTVVYLLLVTGAVLIGRVDFPTDFMGLMFSYWSCVAMGFAFGLTIGALKRFVPMLEEWMMPIRRLGIFISGVIFTAASLPTWMLDYLSWNPLFRAIELARQCWHPAYRSPIATPSYVIICIFGLLAVGIAAERITRRYAGA